MSRTSDATIPVAPTTRDRIKNQKRGGETYDRLLRKMLAQYDPDVDAGDVPATAEAN
jgi:hypothetical protein